VSRTTLTRMKSSRNSLLLRQSKKTRRNTKIVGLKIVTPCSVADSYKAFEGTCSLHSQCNTMLPTYQNTRRHIKKTIIFIFPGVGTTNITGVIFSTVFAHICLTKTCYVHFAEPMLIRHEVQGHAACVSLQLLLLCQTFSPPVSI
jgi:hypothetical protein